MADVNTDQRLPFTVTPKLPDGTPGSVQDGSIVYSSSDETIFKVVDVASDQLSGKIDPLKAGEADLMIDADADPGPDSVPVHGIKHVTVVTGPSGLVASFDVAFGAPESKA